MKKVINIKSNLISLIALSLITIFLQSSTLEASEEKDLILILDTSLSMVGYGGSNILPQVKKSLPKFIEQLEDDDSITFMTFDTRVKVYPTVYIDDDNDKDILKKYISVIDAKGKWTYTSLMVKTALSKAQELEKEDEDRQRILVVMTDALDDPPPGMRRDRLNIKEIAKSYKEKDWFIFLMNFGDLKKNKKMIKVYKELQKNVSKYTKIIDVDDKSSKTGKNDEIRKVIEKDLKDNIEKMEVKKGGQDSSWGSILIAILVIAIVLLALYYLKKYSELKVSGKLEYWNHTVIYPDMRTFNLTKQNHKEITIGKKASLRISEIETHEPFTITAVRDNGEIKNQLYGGKSNKVEYVNRDPGKYLENGDVFRIVNYSFKYTSD